MCITGCLFTTYYAVSKMYNTGCWEPNLYSLYYTIDTSKRLRMCLIVNHKKSRKFATTIVFRLAGQTWQLFTVWTNLSAVFVRPCRIV